MSPTCGLTHRFSHDNLHIALSEHFEQPQVDALIDMLRGQQTHCNRIFIDVRKVTNPQPSAVAAFKTSLGSLSVGPERVFFKGKLGFDLAVNGNKVLIVKKANQERSEEKKHVCKGNCAHCTCGHHKHCAG